MARMSAAHLAPQGGGYEPQRSFDWEIEIYGAPGQELIKLAVESFNPPGANNEAIELPYLNEVVFVAGQGRWDTSDIVVRDFVDTQVYSSLMQWKALVHDPTNGFIGFASQYKKQGDIKLLAPDGSVERSFQMIGLWPINVRGEQLTYSGNENYRVNLTLSVDKAIPGF